MTTPSIRPAVAADIPAITTIYAHAVLHGTASWELDPPDEAEMLRRFEAIAAGGYPYLVAEEAGRLLGYAYAGAYRPRPAYRFVVEDSIYIDPTSKGRGLGTLLLSRLIEATAVLGFRQIVAVIGDGSPGNPSVRLHEKLGFRHAGRLEGSGYKHGRWLDTVFMQLSLNGGRATPPDPDSLPQRRFGRLA